MGGWIFKEGRANGGGGREGRGVKIWTFSRGGGSGLGRGGTLSFSILRGWGGAVFWKPRFVDEEDQVILEFFGRVWGGIVGKVIVVGC